MRLLLVGLGVVVAACAHPVDPVRQAFGRCDTAVKRMLRAPTTAHFDSGTRAITFYGQRRIYRGTVDAANAYGAAIRSPYVCIADSSLVRAALDADWLDDLTVKAITAAGLVTEAAQAAHAIPTLEAAQRYWRGRGLDRFTDSIFAGYHIDILPLGDTTFSVEVTHIATDLRCTALGMRERAVSNAPGCLDFATLSLAQYDSLQKQSRVDSALHAMHETSLRTMTLSPPGAAVHFSTPRQFIAPMTALRRTAKLDDALHGIYGQSRSIDSTRKQFVAMEQSTKRIYYRADCAAAKALPDTGRIYFRNGTEALGSGRAPSKEPGCGDD